MVRGPCCEKMGLKKGPWSPEEDQILVGYIQRYGHGNWRALPKQAGLLRCGKSCRLRWTNYLRPDIKRGNFSKDEEETIITLHEMLGNRWSMIAARLPGRTDNEIKNVWHTHLKKQVKPDQRVEASNRKTQYTAKTETGSEPATVFQNPGLTPDSPARSYSDISYSGTDSSIVTRENYCTRLEEAERIDSREEFPEIDASFWSEALSMDNWTAPAMEFTTSPASPIRKPFGSSCSSNDDDISFWLRTFMEAGDLQDLPEI